MREGEHKISRGSLLDHVEYLLRAVEPDVVVGYGHGLESDLLGVLEVRVRPPDVAEPLDGEQLVLSGKHWQYFLSHFPANSAIESM